MDDQRLGSVLRTLRIRRALTQQQLGDRGRVSRSTVSRVERGHLATVSIAKLRALATVLDVRVETMASWRGGDLERVMNAGHAAMHETIIEFFQEMTGWELGSEVSFSIYGERGVIDVLAFHREHGIVLIVELKTEIVDGQGLVGTMDRRRRLALQIAAERGWVGRTVGVWVVVAESRSNRRRLARQAKLLRLAFPTDGRAMRPWLRRPTGSVSALSFLAEPETLTNAHPGNVGHRFGLPKRVPAGRPRSDEARPPPNS